MPRRRLALAFAVLAALLLPGAALARIRGAPLATQLAEALAVPHVDPSRSSAVAVDLEGGSPLFSRNADLPLLPASNEKLALSYALLVELGPDYQIGTDVLGRGELDGDVWTGSLILRGSGDPSLSTEDLRALAAQVRAAGIRQVTGAVLADESAFDSRRTAPGWKASFFIDESPPLSALVVDRARYGGRTSHDPARTAAAIFRDALTLAGVEVDGGLGRTRATEEEQSNPLATTASPTLAELLRFMDRESDNFTAEELLKELGAFASGRGTTAAGAAEVTRVLAAAGVPLAGVRIVDGSGLSRLDRLTAGALVGILQAAWRDPPLRDQLMRALPVAGVSGTLEDRMRTPPARGNVLAKTGTTELASALSGYVRGRFAFALLQNGNPVSPWWARRAQDRFATVLAGQ